MFSIVSRLSLHSYIQYVTLGCVLGMCSPKVIYVTLRCVLSEDPRCAHKTS